MGKPTNYSATTCYIRQDQYENLKALSARTKVPIAEYIRQGVDLALAKHLPEGEQANDGSESDGDRLHHRSERLNGEHPG